MLTQIFMSRHVTTYTGLLTHSFSFSTCIVWLGMLHTPLRFVTCKGYFHSPLRLQLVFFFIIFYNITKFYQEEYTSIHFFFLLIQTSILFNIWNMRLISMNIILKCKQFYTDNKSQILMYLVKWDVLFSDKKKKGHFFLLII
jgi:hypothetical protein